MKKKGLTLKQAKFTKEYLKSGNGTQAAIKAGYSKNSAHDIASENLRKPYIQAAVASAAEKLGINPEFVLGNIKKATEITGKTYTKTIGQGENVSVFEDMVDSQAFIKANELLGKHLALFVEPKDNSVNNTQINFYQTASDLSNESVAKLIDVSVKVKKKGIEGII